MNNIHTLTYYKCHGRTARRCSWAPRSSGKLRTSLMASSCTCACTTFNLLAHSGSSTWASPEYAIAKPPESSPHFLSSPSRLLIPSFLVTHVPLPSSIHLHYSHHSPRNFVPVCSYYKALAWPVSHLHSNCPTCSTKMPKPRPQRKHWEHNTMFVVLILLSGLRPSSACD